MVIMFIFCCEERYFQGQETYFFVRFKLRNLQILQLQIKNNTLWQPCDIILYIRNEAYENAPSKHGCLGVAPTSKLMEKAQS